MDARQKAIEALRGIADLECGSREEESCYCLARNDAATIRALAKAIEGGQEMWQHRGDPEAVHTIEDDDEPHDWIKSDYRRVLVIEWPEEKP